MVQNSGGFRGIAGGHLSSIFGTHPHLNKITTEYALGSGRIEYYPRSLLKIPNSTCHTARKSFEVGGSLSCSAKVSTDSMHLKALWKGRDGNEAHHDY
jgi:hypothetical protein